MNLYIRQSSAANFLRKLYAKTPCIHKTECNVTLKPRLPVTKLHLL